MGSLFRLDGEVYRFMEEVANLILVSIFWTLFSLPVFTIGAASTALYYTTYKAIRNDTGHVWREFLLAFKSNFKQATLLWLLLVLMVVFLGFDCYVAYILSGIHTALQWVLILLVVLLTFLAVWSQYWFAYIAHISDPIKTVLKNTLVMCVLQIPKSLALFAVFGICLFLFLNLPQAPFFLIILPGIYMYFASWIFKKVFSQYWDMQLPVS